MTAEDRRRAYLGAMQVVSWMPRVSLPFAAPSRPELLDTSRQVELSEPVESLHASGSVGAPVVCGAAPAAAVPGRARPELVRPSQRIEVQTPAVDRPTEPGGADSEPLVAARPPRFSLQLLRAGACLLLVELPTGEPFQSRDPAYLLLRDLLRAAGLPDSPQQVGDGEPIRWPLLSRGAIDQGPEAARDYVQTVLMREREGAACIWLVGLAAVRFGGEREDDAYCSEFAMEQIGPGWAVPGLELLMEEPQRKAGVWQSMRRLMPRWSSESE